MFCGRDQPTNTLAAVAAVGAVSLLLILGFYNKKFNILQKPSRSRLALKNNDENDDDNYNTDCVEVNLMTVDIVLHKFCIPPVGTITWVSGSYQTIIPFLKARMNKILFKNPWLAGRIVKSRHTGKLVLRHPAQLDFERGEDFFCLIPEDQSPLNHSMPLLEMSRLSSQFTINRSGPNCGPLWSVCVVPCRSKPSTKFAIIMSLSHTLGGASTYYSLLSMLTRVDTEVEGLEIERIPNAEQHQIKLFGYDEVQYFCSNKSVHPFIKGSLHALITRAPIKQYVFMVDNDKMKAEKGRYVSADVPFVSTNDVLVSWFAQHSRADYTFMPVDTKGKLPHFTTNKAGNYHIAVIYGKEDLATPGLVRKSLMTSQDDGMIRRVVTKGVLPSYWQVLLWTHYGGVTNWASFSKPILLPKECHCTEDLHTPTQDVHGFLPTTYTEMVIFRHSPGRTAIRITGHKVDWVLRNQPSFLYCVEAA